MQKDQAYHESAIAYNEGLAEFAENLAPTLPHPEVRRWCEAVGKQHRFHAKRHQAGLDKLLASKEKGTDDPVEPVELVREGLDVPEPSEEIEGHDVIGDPETEVELPQADVGASTEEAAMAEHAMAALQSNLDDERIAEDDAVNEVYDDGCVKFHKPTDPNCEFYPTDARPGFLPPKGDDNA